MLTSQANLQRITGRIFGAYSSAQLVSSPTTHIFCSTWRNCQNLGQMQTSHANNFWFLNADSPPAGHPPSYHFSRFPFILPVSHSLRLSSWLLQEVHNNSNTIEESSMGFNELAIFNNISRLNAALSAGVHLARVADFGWLSVTGPS